MQPKHKLTRLAASGAISSAACQVFGVVLTPAAAASTIKLTNDGTGAGTAVLLLSAAANGPSVVLDLTSMGGVNFDTALYGTLGGLGAEVYVWFD